MVGNYRVAIQLVGSRVVLTSIELVLSKGYCIPADMCDFYRATRRHIPEDFTLRHPHLSVSPTSIFSLPSVYSPLCIVLPFIPSARSCLHLQWNGTHGNAEQSIHSLDVTPKCSSQ
jgi:hypothetical protein